MKVKDLIRELQQYDGDLEVKMAYQPNYPLEASVEGAISREEALKVSMYDEVPPADAEMTEEQELAERIERAGGDAVYILQGTQDAGYADRYLWSGR